MVKKTCLSLSIRMWNHGDLSGFERGMIVGSREDCLSFRKLLIYWDFQIGTMISRVGDLRKATVTQITTGDNQGLRNSIYEWT